MPKNRYEEDMTVDERCRILSKKALLTNNIIGIIVNE